MKTNRGPLCALLLAGLLLLTSCNGPEPEETAADPAEIAAAVLDSQTDLPELVPLEAGDEAFDAYLEGYYQIDPAEVEGGYLYYAEGAEASEIAVLMMNDQKDAELAVEAFYAYIDRRAGDFAGYFPEQAALTETGTAVSAGRYVALLICPEPELAEAAFLAWFVEAPVPAEEETPLPAGAGPTEVPPTPTASSEEAVLPTPVETETIPPSVPPTAPPEPSADGEDLYDGIAVRAAWQSGDPSALSGKNRAVYEACQSVLEELISEGMSEYEKELAVHDWMIGWGSYDSEQLSHHPNGQSDPDNTNPYGFLLSGKGICTGYSTTFQLLMDLVGIPCVTVEGTAHGGGAEHAWNLVQLEGEWYGVDVTWDDPMWADPVSQQAAHRYFNVTSEYLRAHDHQWDDAGVPEAAGMTYIWSAPAADEPVTPAG